jgi:hypothetical protein
MASIKQNLVNIGKLNLHLADKLAELPEIRWFKTDSSRLALDNLLNLYRLAPDRFDHMFAQMITIGLPAHRPFCSPLQALLQTLTIWTRRFHATRKSSAANGGRITRHATIDGLVRSHIYDGFVNSSRSRLANSEE